MSEREFLLNLKARLCPDVVVINFHNGGLWEILGFDIDIFGNIEYYLEEFEPDKPRPIRPMRDRILESEFASCYRRLTPEEVKDRS